MVSTRFNGPCAKTNTKDEVAVVPASRFMSFLPGNWTHYELLAISGVLPQH
jgi:hypothetical protein